jgi:glycosyltransferase involved in cell wall biosynthesis
VSPERPLRLCFAVADFPERGPGRNVVGGGIGAHAYSLSRAVAALGHEVHVLTEGDEDESYVDNGLRVRALRRGSRRHWKLGSLLPLPWMQRAVEVRRGVLRLHRERPLDLVRFPDGYGEGAAYCHRPVVPFVVHLHGPASVLQRWDGRRIPPVRRRVERWIERRPARRASLLIAGTRWFADLMTKEWGLDARRIRIIRNPIDTDQFRPSVNGAGPRSRTILFAGHLQWFKGVSVLAAAVPRVLSRHPEARFLFVGNDTRSAPGGGSLKAYVEQELRAAGALDRTRFVDPVPAAELVRHYHESAGLVLPSFQEVYGNVVVEAMACGRPCVVTRTVGAAELVVPGKSGFVVPPNDPDALAHALGELLDLPDDARSRMGHEGRRTVELSCAAEVIASETVKAYREVLPDDVPR